MNLKKTCAILAGIGIGYMSFLGNVYADSFKIARCNHNINTELQSGNSLERSIGNEWNNLKKETKQDEMLRKKNSRMYDDFLDAVKYGKKGKLVLKKSFLPGIDFLKAVKYDRELIIKTSFVPDVLIKERLLYGEDVFKTKGNGRIYHNGQSLSLQDFERKYKNLIRNPS